MTDVFLNLKETINNLFSKTMPSKTSMLIRVSSRYYTGSTSVDRHDVSTSATEFRSTFQKSIDENPDRQKVDRYHVEPT